MRDEGRVARVCYSRIEGDDQTARRCDFFFC